VAEKEAHNIRLNQQWRLCFEFKSGDAFNVEMTDSSLGVNIMINNPFHLAVFLQELLEDMDITTYHLAKDTVMPATRVSETLKQRRSITTDSALRLA
jgi:proteic killer suppression protein